MEEQDIVFTRHDKMYVTDFSDWVYNDHRRERERSCIRIRRNAGHWKQVSSLGP